MAGVQDWSGLRIFTPITISFARGALRALGVVVWAMERYEADDALASCSASRKWIENFRDGGSAAEAFREIQQVFGDTFICAGLTSRSHSRDGKARNRQVTWCGPVTLRKPSCGRLDHSTGKGAQGTVAFGIWLVFNRSLCTRLRFLCELMALHGMAFARYGDEWRIVMSDEPDKTPALRDFLLFKAKQ